MIAIHHTGSIGGYANVGEGPFDFGDQQSVIRALPQIGSCELRTYAQSPAPTI
jgi:hypothetical protein